MAEMICLEDFGCRRELCVGRYLDPFDSFREKETAFEIRTDGITGATCRVLPYRVWLQQKQDLGVYLANSPEASCPFCTPNFERITPRFVGEVCGEGQFRRGEAILFPNAFPHDRHNTVVRFSPRHFVAIVELTPDLTLEGFLVCRDYFRRMVEVYRGLKFCSINWNFMPPAGGGLLHPHIQTVIGDAPTRFMATLRESARRHRENTGGNLWEDLVDYERRAGERYIARTGPIHWIVSFAPRGMAGEIAFFFEDRRSFFDLTEEDFGKLMAGLARIFRYLDGKNFVSFNLALYAATGPDDDLRVQGRLMPRFVMLPLGTSDINYFEKLHEEIICPVVPEDLCRELQAFF